MTISEEVAIKAGLVQNQEHKIFALINDIYEQQNIV